MAQKDIYKKFIPKEFGIKWRPMSRKKKQKMTKQTWTTLTYVVALLIRRCLENCRLQMCCIPACEVLGHLIGLVIVNIQLKRRLCQKSLLTARISKREDDPAVLVVDCIDQAS